MYAIWKKQQIKKLIDDAVQAGSPPPSIEDAELIVTSDPDHDVKWMASKIYQKLVLDKKNPTRIPKGFNTEDRFTTGEVKKRSAEIQKEKPDLSEEEVAAQAQEDVAKREERDQKNVKDSKDPVAAKILTNISSILMDISENVIALRESGANALDEAEANREKGKDKKGEEKEKSKGMSRFELFLDGIILMLAPFFLGLASKVVDLTKPFGLLKGAVLALTMMFLTRLALLKAASVVMPAARGVLDRINPFSRPPTTGLPGATVPGTPGIPSPTGTATGGAGMGGGPVSALTTLGKGIKDLGEGAGSAIKSILTGITDGFKYMGENLRDVLKGALALAAIGVAFVPFALSLKLLKDVNAGAVLAATIGIGLVSASVIALGNAGNSIYQGIGALAALGIAFVPFALSLKLLKDVNVGAVLAATLAIGVVSAVVIALGNAGSSIYQGVLALAVLGGAMAIFGAALSTISGIDGGELLKVGAAIVGFGLLAALLGGALSAIALGSLAIALLGGALFIFGNALETISGIDEKALLTTGKALIGFGLVAAGLGLMFPMIALGAAAMVVLAGGLMVVGKALEVAAPSLESAAESINKLGEIDGSNLLEVAKGIAGIGLVAAGLGLLFPAIALGAAAMVILAGGLMVVGKALEVVAPNLESAADSINKFGEIDGSNLLKVAAGIAGIGLAMVAFSASMLAASAMGVGSAILGLFVDSPLENLLEFAEDAKDVDVAGAAAAVSKLSKAIKQLDSISGANLFNIGAGLSAVAAGLVAFSAANVTAGLGNLVTKFLSFLSGGKTPIEQIIELSEKHKEIFEAGKGVESMGKGVDAFAGVDTEKLTRTIEIITKLSDSDLEKLAKFQAVQSQPAATQQLGQAREGVNNAQEEKSSQSTPAVVNNVNQTAVNKNDTTYKSTRAGPAVKGDALQMGA